MEETPRAIPGRNPQMNSWSISPEELLVKIPTTFPGGEPRMNSWSTSSMRKSRKSFWSNSWRDSQRNFCKNSWQKFMDKTPVLNRGGNSRRSFWRKSPEELLEQISGGVSEGNWRNSWRKYPKELFIILTHLKFE